MVLSTVATWSITLNSRDESGLRSKPSTCLNISRWPLLLMGRYSDSPCTMPRIRASIQSIVRDMLVSAGVFGAVDDGKSHEHESEERYGRSDDYASGAEYVGVELLGGCAAAKH